MAYTHLTHILRVLQILHEPTDISHPSKELKEPVVSMRRTSAPVVGMEGVPGEGVAATGGGDEARVGGEHGADAGCLSPRKHLSETGTLHPAPH